MNSLSDQEANRLRLFREEEAALCELLPRYREFPATDLEPRSMIDKWIHQIDKAFVDRVTMFFEEAGHLGIDVKEIRGSYTYSWTLLTVYGIDMPLLQFKEWLKLLPKDRYESQRLDMIKRSLSEALELCETISG